MLVTGANGFVGQAMTLRLLAEGRRVHAAARGDSAIPAAAQRFAVGDLDGDGVDWRLALQDVQTIVHCAARVHVLSDREADPSAAFRKVNRDATVRLARAAAATGVCRFVFMSTIGVNGAETVARPFAADDTPAPHSPYAQSKHEAELALNEIAAATGLEVAIVRPPLVYGPGAPGNFRLLTEALRRGLPLPLAAVRNRRSFVAIDNLVDLVTKLATAPGPVGGTYVVADGEDLSTADLLRRLGAALGRPARLFSMPPSLLRFGLAALGRRELAQRLLGSLQIDISATCQALDWRPPVSVDAALVRVAQHIINSGD